MKTLWSLVRVIIPFLGMVTFSITAFSSDFSALAEQEKSDLNQVYKICHTDADLIIKAHISFEANLLETSEDKKCMYMQLNSEELAKLQGFGFTSELAMNWIVKKQQALNQLQQEAVPQATAASIPGYSCYETVEETFSVAQGLATDHPTLATWFDIGDSWEKTNGLGGWDLMVLKLTNSAVTGDKPILFINSALHAREYTTAPLVLNFAKHLVNNYGVDADATWILDYHEVHLLLIANPDGRKKAETGLSWRKNTNQNYCGATSNNRGADLNRNFTFGWNSAGGSSGNPCNLTYRGPSPASEPETQAIEAYVRSIYADNRGPNPTDAAPDDTTGIHLDIHSYSELVLWPWGTTSTVAPNGIQMQTLGRKFAYWNGYTPQQAIGLYPTDGTTEGVSYGELGVPAYTFELGTAFFQSCSTYTNTILPDNMPALIYAAKVVGAPYLIPSGPNVENVSFSPSTATSGTAVTLTATVSDARFSTRGGTESTQNISEVEYYVTTPPWVSSPTPVANAMSAVDGSFNEKTEDVTATIDTSGWANGKYMIFVRGKDTSNAWGAISAGYLTISDDIPPPEYCSSQGNSVRYEWVDRVDVGTFSNTSGAAGYSDFTSQVIDVTKGQSYSATFSPGFASSSYLEYWKVWIDFNQDGDFADSGEEVFSQNGNSDVSGSIAIPASANTGNTRMRVSMRYNANPSSCGSFTYGEVEDYTVNIGN
ncbi:MAG: M14 family metallopeptidase [Proteobacteria bacterium]|nr:M14 family metallopeptidase [Pseudomonadota bacterium]